MIPLEAKRVTAEVFRTTLKDPVKFDHFTQKPLRMLVPGREECASCPDARELFEDLCGLNSLLRLTVHEFGQDPALDRRLGVERVPATVMRGVLNRPITMYGVPAGPLFGGLSNAVLSLSVNDSSLPQAARKKLKRLRDVVSLRLFVSVDSPQSPEMMSIAAALGIESRYVKVEIIEAAEFPRLVERYRVQQVPLTVINDQSMLPGLFDAETYADLVVQAATHRTVLTGPRGESSPFGVEPRSETTRPSGLIIPGR
jgi:hypothetical protein